MAACIDNNIRRPEKLLADFCCRNRISKMSFFGSVLRSDFGPHSDVDVLVEFEGGYSPGLEFFGMQRELSKILGRKVDLRTPKDIGEQIRSRVLAEAEVQYVHR